MGVREPKASRQRARELKKAFMPRSNLKKRLYAKRNVKGVEVREEAVKVVLCYCTLARFSSEHAS
jgi:hypothetical protein